MKFWYAQIVHVKYIVRFAPARSNAFATISNHHFYRYLCTITPFQMANLIQKLHRCVLLIDIS
jgi:hypothetical protein